MTPPMGKLKCGSIFYSRKRGKGNMNLRYILRELAATGAKIRGEASCKARCQKKNPGSGWQDAVKTEIE